MSKKINLDFAVLDLDGKEIEGAHAGKIVANLLVSNQNTKDPLKFFAWGQKLYNNTELELEGEDVKVFESAVKDSALPVLTKAQILKAI